MATETGDARIRLPDRIRQGELIQVHAIIAHPMDTGLARKDEWTMVPAYFIESVTVVYGEKTVARFRWSSALSRDPLITFQLRADREAQLTVTWKDNRAAVFQASVPIGFTEA